MSTFAFLLVCVQASLVQYAYGQCIGSAMGAAFAPGFLVPRYAPSVIPTYAPAVPAAIAPGAYGGEGIGEIAIAGRMPVAGTTAVAGQVPILGSVRFGGDVVAGGSVTITGHCGCGGRYY